VIIEKIINTLNINHGQEGKLHLGTSDKKKNKKKLKLSNG